MVTLGTRLEKMGLTHAAEAGAVLKGLARERHAGRLALEGVWLEDPLEVWAALHEEMVVAWAVAMMGSEDKWGA